MPTNFYMYFVTALIPLLVGSIYYHPKTLGSIWMKSNGFTEESLAAKGGNMAVILGLTYLLGVFLSMMFGNLTIHQSGVVASAMHGSGELSAEAIADINAFFVKYGNSYRTFGHGAVHGVMYSLFIALPIISINAMFERRGWKYTAVHWGYWAIVLMLICGTLCQTLEFAPLG